MRTVMRCAVLALLFAGSGGWAQGDGYVIPGSAFEAELRANRVHAPEDLAAAEPADFPAGLFGRLVGYDRDPEAAGILANCRAFVEGTSVRQVSCFLANPEHRDNFARDIEKIAGRSRVQPATVGGEEQSTWLYFRVFLARSGGEPAVHYFPNWGHDADVYGHEYHAPQQITGDHDMICRGARIISLLRIGTDGHPEGNVEFDIVSGEPKPDCLEALRKMLLMAQYVPARFHDRPVAARHMGYWGR